MDKLIFKTIEDEVGIGLFLQKVENYSHVRLPLLYAKNSKIVGVFLQNKLVAGYMLVTKPDFRSLLFVPDNIKKEIPFFRSDQFEMMEVNGLWIGPALKTPGMQIAVWSKLIKDIFLCRKKYVLLMRNSRNQSMKKFMGMANPQELYEGPPISMPGDKTHDSIQVSFTTRWKIIFNTHKYLIEYLERQKRASMFNFSRTNDSSINSSDSKAHYVV